SSLAVGLRHRFLPVERNRQMGPASTPRGIRAGFGIRMARSRHPGDERRAPPALSENDCRRELMMHRIRIVNNYLSNIAARALNQAPTVRPRLRGRFDPASPANEPAVDGLKLAPTESIDSERLVENNPVATSENQMAHERLHASRRPSDENEPHTLSFAHRG